MARDIISLTAFPKSGVTLLSSLLYYCLFPESHDPSEIEKRYVIDRHVFSLDGAQKHNGTIFIKSHSPFRMNDPLIERTKKVLYLVRDPIDVMSSAYDYFGLVGNKPDVPFDKFADEWIRSKGGAFDIAGPWTEHVQAWTNQTLLPLMMIRYSDLVERPREEMNRIFSFCELSPKEGDIAVAVEQSSMRSMRAREEEEFASKRNGVFYNAQLAQTMAKGARFINKGHHGTHLRLSPTQRRAANRQFGQLAKKHLNERHTKPNWRTALTPYYSTSQS